MANHKSAAKRAKQNIKRRERNRAKQSVVKAHIRTVLTAIEGKKADDIKTTLASAVSAIEKARASGLLHRNNASRKIGRLTIRAAKASAAK